MLKTAQILQGRYQLRKQLANNAGRQTWLAQDLNSSPPEPVIVKLLAFSPQMQWDEFKLFEREAAVLKQLNHPQIPNYRDYFSLDKETGAGLYWFGLVQEYIPGKSLQQLLDQGYHFSETQVRSIAIQVLKILQYLHGLKPPVLHRDIKPNNLILGQDKRVYLVDFGAVQNSAAVEGVTFTVVGTSGYAPLEQFWGQAVEASDLYALGASLIHLLTGISPADLPQRELRIQFRDKVSINSQFLNWIEALSEPDLELRFKTASQALKTLKKGQLIKDENPQVIKPPAFSKIKIDKSADQLRITISEKLMLRWRDLFLLSIKVPAIMGVILGLIVIAIIGKSKIIIDLTLYIFFFSVFPMVILTLSLVIIIPIVILMSDIGLFGKVIFTLSQTILLYVVLFLARQYKDKFPDYLNQLKFYFNKLNYWLLKQQLKISNEIFEPIIKDIKKTSFIYLNIHQIKLDREWFIIKNKQSSLLANLLEFFLSPAKNSPRKTGSDNKDSQWYCQREQTFCINEIAANSSYHQIYIQTMNETYTIKGLSKAECKWMLKEIKTWLAQCQ